MENIEAEEQTLVARLFDIAKKTPGQEAIVTKEYSLTYIQILELIDIQTQALSELGINEESIVGIRCVEEPKHLILSLACSYIGATSLTIPSYETEKVQSKIAQRSNCTKILDEENAIELSVLDNLTLKDRVLRNKIDSQFLFSSSGTTGEAKLVIHNASDLVAQAHRHVNSPSERFLCLASIEHNFAKRHRLYCLAQGATNIFINTSDNLVKQCKHLNVDVLHVSVFQAQQLLAESNISELSHLRLKLGGSHAPISLRKQLKESITQNLQAGYGTTETGAICFTEADDMNAGESVGKTLPGIEIRTVNKKREVLPLGDKGELAIRCTGMFRGYLEKPELTAATLENNWFYTGDIGYLDQQQRLYLSGRADDMFVFNSINIYPQDIESVLKQFPSVEDAAVVPKESEVHGNIPIALIVFNAGIKQDVELQKLQEFALSELGLRCPQQFITVDEIPRNASGKVSRVEAEKLVVVDSQIREIIIGSLLNSKALDNFKSDKIERFREGQEDIKFSHIAMDSIVLMNLLVKIEILYDKVISPYQYTKLGTLNDIVDIVLSDEEKEYSNKNITNNNYHDSLRSNDFSEPPYLVRFLKK